MRTLNHSLKAAFVLGLVGVFVGMSAQPASAGWRRNRVVVVGGASLYVPPVPTAAVVAAPVATMAPAPFAPAVQAAAYVPTSVMSAPVQAAYVPTSVMSAPVQAAYVPAAVVSAPVPAAYYVAPAAVVYPRRVIYRYRY